jgi:magnesium transporter
MLISCAAYQDGTKVGDISAAQIAEYLRRPRCFVWVVLLYFRFKKAKWL